MKEAANVDVTDTLAKYLSKKQGKKKMKIAERKTSEKGQKKKVQEEATRPEEGLPQSTMEDENVFDVSPGITVSLFDFSIENHFQAIDTICKLNGEPKSCEMEMSEVDRLSSSVTFLSVMFYKGHLSIFELLEDKNHLLVYINNECGSEWMHFEYPSRVIRFACENGKKEDSSPKIDVCGESTLPQFSAATVPKNNEEDGCAIPPEYRKDFVMYVGGLVWALDWCPRVHHKLDSEIKCEYIAVAAHPPESSYHKIGAPLVGRGLIQIWCILNAVSKEEESQNNDKSKMKFNNKPTTEAKPRGRPRKYPEKISETSESKKPRGRPRKYPEKISETSEIKKPRGRPRKNPIDVPVENSNDNILCVEAISYRLPENSRNLLLTDIASVDNDKNAKRVSARKGKGHHPGLFEDDVLLTSLPKKKKMKNIEKIENTPVSTENPVLCSNSEPGLVAPSMSILKSCTSENTDSKNPIPKEVALPRVVLCLAHNGKVAWDVKWRPFNVDDAAATHGLGYLAVLLGNGALEVWEVPSPQTVKAIYSTRGKRGNDPRFLKLEPVFRCLKVKFGDRQSIPLTLEWSTFAPHDLILAGCHDGVVALWKFSPNSPTEDTRPLLCFSADTVPIRALAWAPIESGPESENVVVTAGHKGLKFWDLRDPFRPLWHLNPVQLNIYSLDWLPDPRCVVVSFDDGTLRILSLVKSANDVPVTGQCFVGTQQQGFPSYYCSSFAIWSVQVSRLTGMVAYCGAEGNVLQFQLTHKAVEKDPHRNRAQHFLCGSLSEKDSIITIMNPFPNIPFPMKKYLNESANTPRSIRGYRCESNQVKRAKGNAGKGNNMSEEETRALCNGDDPGTGSESEDLMVSQKTKSKSKSNNNKKGKTESALAKCGDEDQTNNLGTEDCGEKKVVEIEKLPSKMVSMHRVRWNMNKGSERWLCSGGAAGVVRVQEIKKPSSE